MDLGLREVMYSRERLGSHFMGVVIDVMGMNKENLEKVWNGKTWGCRFEAWGNQAHKNLRLKEEPVKGMKSWSEKTNWGQKPRSQSISTWGEIRCLESAKKSGRVRISKWWLNNDIGYDTHFHVVVRHKTY